MSSTVYRCKLSNHGFILNPQDHHHHNCEGWFCYSFNVCMQTITVELIIISVVMITAPAVITRLGPGHRPAAQQPAHRGRVIMEGGPGILGNMHTLIYTAPHHATPDM